MSSMCVCLGNIVQLKSDLTAIVAVNTVQEYTAGNGISIEDGTISVKVDPTDTILSVTEDGLKAEINSASEESLGGIRIWVADEYLNISTESGGGE